MKLINGKLLQDNGNVVTCPECNSFATTQGTVEKKVVIINQGCNSSCAKFELSNSNHYQVMLLCCERKIKLTENSNTMEY
jgi:hypothetical protein